MTRREVISDAVNKCFRELYSYAQPSITYDDFIEECKLYSKKYKEWESYRRAIENNDNKVVNHIAYAEWKDKSIDECIGPRPYEFYYLPKEILDSVCKSYINAYKLDTQQEFLDNIEVLKKYCKEPIVDKYIEVELREDGTRCPGHRGYDHPDNLEKELYKLLRDKAGFSVTNGAIENLSKEVQNKFFEFLDMAGKFYNWTRDLGRFNINVYLGPSPYSIKEKVIENWKKYRNKDIEIDEEQMLKKFYGEEDD